MVSPFCCEPGGFVAKPVQEAINSVYSGDETPFNHYFMADGKTFAARNPEDPKAMILESESILNWGQGPNGLSSQASQAVHRMERSLVS